MSVTSGGTEARLALNAIINAEFAAEHITAINDRLHESLGVDGTRVGTSPNRQRPLPGQELVMTYEIHVQFYLKWRSEIDPKTRVDPAPIETYAERFLRAIQGNPRVGDARLWFFKVTDINYPLDPTGNKTRFEATVLAYGNNSGLMETTG